VLGDDGSGGADRVRERRQGRRDQGHGLAGGNQAHGGDRARAEQRAGGSDSRAFPGLPHAVGQPGIGVERGRQEPAGGAQTCQGDRLLAPSRCGGHHHEGFPVHHRHLELTGAQALELPGAGAVDERHVGLAVPYVVERVRLRGVEHLDADAGRELLEETQQPGQNGHARGRRAGDRQPPGSTGPDGAHHGLRLLEEVEDLGGPLDQVAAGLGRLHAAWMPLEQGDAQLSFELGDGGAERRLGHGQPLCGSGHRALVDDRGQVAQLA
jgi:hypothetical protein